MTRLDTRRAIQRVTVMCIHESNFSSRHGEAWRVKLNDGLPMHDSDEQSTLCPR
jgi:hypothetical protein